MCRRDAECNFVRVITRYTVVKVIMSYSNKGFKSYCIVSSVASVISVVMVIKAI